MTIVQGSSLHVVSDELELGEAVAGTEADFIVLIRGDAVLCDDAIDTLSEIIGRFPESDLLYGDDDVARRPAFSPVRLRGQDYLGPVLALRTERIRSLGGLRAEATGAHGYDLALRLSAAGASIVYVPAVLAAPGAGFDDTHEMSRALPIVRHHLGQLGIQAEVSHGRGSALDLRYALEQRPLVSIVIPTRGGSAVIAGTERVMVLEAVRGIREHSSYDNVEFVIVADDATPQSVIDELDVLLGERLVLVRWSAPFNFSAKMNRGAVHANGEYLLLLNDDVELVTPDWIERLLGLAQQKDVGLASGLLYFEDGTVQHGGHLYAHGQAGHIGIGWPADADDELGSMSVDREVSGATAACAMVSTDDFWAVGGFSSLLPGNYNDVDFCLKLRSIGRSVIWSPHVKLYHFESKTREATVAPSEIAALRSRWNSRIQVDAYWPATGDDRR